MIIPDANHGAGIFTYIYPKNGPVMEVNIPAPWFASGYGRINDNDHHLKIRKKGM